MLLEPSGPHVQRGPAAGLSDDLRAAAGLGAVVLAVAGGGDAFLLAALLGVAAADRWAGLTAGIVAAALLARWGTSSLAAVAGAQAVLGPAVLVGPPAGAVSAVLGAAALLLAAPAGPAAVAFGAAAGVVAAGPAVGGPVDFLVRAVGVAGGAYLATTHVDRVPRRVRRAAPAVAVAAFVLAAAS